MFYTVPGSAGHGVHLEVDVLNFAELAEVLLDVGVLGLLGQRAHKQLPVILVHGIGHGGVCCLLQRLPKHTREQNKLIKAFRFQVTKHK